MKNIIGILLISLLIVSCSSSRVTVERDFYVVLGSCFKEDMVSFSVNNVLAFEKINLNSDFSTGTVLNVSVEYHSGQLVTRINKDQKTNQLQIDNEIYLLINRNGQEHNFDLDLSKGKYILIEGCESTIKVKQSKKKMVFE